MEVPTFMDETNQEPTRFEQPVQMPPQNTSGGNLAIAALVCGILGLVGGFIPVVQYFTLILAILAVIFGVKARKTAPPDKRGMATIGMVLGIIGLGLTVIAIICVAVCAGAFLSGLGSLY